MFAFYQLVNKLLIVCVDRHVDGVQQSVANDDNFTLSDYCGNSDDSLYNEEEPLYQIYHQNAIVREVIYQNTSRYDDDG